jgi:UDP-N-acetylglucosamine 2-epimerase (non-hydrolysing)
VTPSAYVLTTRHRPSNVDDPEVLRGLLDAMTKLSRKLPVLFPVHPRTRARIQELGAPCANGTLKLLEPVGYLDFLRLMDGAALVITDSGGVQGFGQRAAVNLSSVMRPCYAISARYSGNYPKTGN